MTKKRKKLLFIFGTRPETIKLSPLIHEFKKHPRKVNIKICVTAQHREMLDQILNVFKLKPDFDLNIMKSGQDLFYLTKNILVKTGEILQKVKPDLIFVQGDTTTVLFAALAAFYLNIRVAHIEAGLRTYNLRAPFPEEANRHLASVLTTYHFTPTKKSARNLLNENIPGKNVFITGNTVIDALLYTSNLLENKPEIITGQINKVFKNIDFSRRIILVTGHRRESFGQGFRNICAALKKIALTFPDVQIVYPVHLNPNVHKPVYNILRTQKNIILLQPLDYLSFVYLMKKSYLILTDSGGIQEEAPSLGKPVLIMREKTERPEGITAGTAKLVGTGKEKIVSATISLLKNKNKYNKMAKAVNPYGNGKASKKIVEIVLKRFD